MPGEELLWRLDKHGPRNAIEILGPARRVIASFDAWIRARLSHSTQSVVVHVDAGETLKKKHGSLPVTVSKILIRRYAVPHQLLQFLQFRKSPFLFARENDFPRDLR